MFEPNAITRSNCRATTPVLSLIVVVNMTVLRGLPIFAVTTILATATSGIFTHTTTSLLFLAILSAIRYNANKGSTNEYIQIPRRVYANIRITNNTTNMIDDNVITTTATTTNPPTRTTPRPCAICRAHARS